MIIKSMARKEQSFAQLYDYITRDQAFEYYYRHTHNFIRQNRSGIIQEFHRNAELLRRRKNSNYLYHEIISITRSKQISEQRQKEILHEIVAQYVQSRAKNCLVFGGLHDEKENNLHFHLMISANQLNDRKRYRLSKKQFSEVKKGLESYVLEKYPELEQEKLITKEKNWAKSSNKEQELKRRTKQPSQKDQMREKLRGLFLLASSKQQFFELLSTHELSLYVRGKHIGIINESSGKKHRLNTLELMNDFQKLSKLIGLDNLQADKNERTQQSTTKENMPKNEKVNKAQNKFNKFRKEQKSHPGTSKKK